MEGQDLLCDTCEEFHSKVLIDGKYRAFTSSTKLKPECRPRSACVLAVTSIII